MIVHLCLTVLMILYVLCTDGVTFSGTCCCAMDAVPEAISSKETTSGGIFGTTDVVYLWLSPFSYF